MDGCRAVGRAEWWMARWEGVVEEDGAERMFGVGGGWVEWPWRHGEAAVDLNLILKG